MISSIDKASNFINPMDFMKSNIDKENVESKENFEEKAFFSLKLSNNSSQIYNKEELTSYMGTMLNIMDNANYNIGEDSDKTIIEQMEESDSALNKLQENIEEKSQEMTSNNAQPLSHENQLVSEDTASTQNFSTNSTEQSQATNTIDGELLAETAQATIEDMPSVDVYA